MPLLLLMDPNFAFTMYTILFNNSVSGEVKEVKNFLLYDKFEILKVVKACLQYSPAIGSAFNYWISLSWFEDPFFPINTKFFPPSVEKSFVICTALRLHCTETWICISCINNSQILMFSSDTFPLHLWQYDLVKKKKQLYQQLQNFTAYQNLLGDMIKIFILFLFPYPKYLKW